MYNLRICFCVTEYFAAEILKFEICSTGSLSVVIFVVMGYFPLKVITLVFVQDILKLCILHMCLERTWNVVLSPDYDVRCFV